MLLTKHGTVCSKNKKKLSELVMSKAVEDAQKWVRLMVNRESTGPGDRVNAMRRLSRRHGVPYGTLWGLLYRPPQDLFVSVYQKLEKAYQSEIDKGINSLRHEKAITEAKSWLSKNLVSAADALAGEDD